MDIKQLRIWFPLTISLQIIDRKQRETKILYRGEMQKCQRRIG